MRLIKDLGTKFATENSKRKYRFGLYECPFCLKEFEAISSSVNSKHTTKCRSCATSLYAKRVIEDFYFSLSRESVCNLFLYKDGSLYFRKKVSSSINIGDKAGCVSDNGYVNIKIKGKTYKAHRLIWVYHNGFTNKHIDHIDHNPSNNNIENLRTVTHQENCQNRKIRKDNTSGINGVMWNKGKKKWEVYLSNKYIGSFIDIDEAMITRSKVEEQANYHKNHGKDLQCLK